MSRDLSKAPVSMGPSEVAVLSASAYGAGCHGCQRHGADVMVSFGAEVGRVIEVQGSGVLDFFLNRDAARRLAERLAEALAEGE